MPVLATPRVGCLPSVSALSGVSTFSPAATVAVSMTTSSSQSPRLSLQLPLATLASPSKVASEDTNQALSVGPHSPPIPKKLAEKIWRSEFIELSELLPSRLGIPQPTLLDVLAPSTPKPPVKQISSIEEWVMCFNSFLAIMAMKHPEKTKELLAYSSVIVKASKEFEGLPWLEYDSRFRKEVAVNQSKSWAVIDASAWTLCFANAKPKVGKARSTASMAQRNESRFQPYKRPPICRNYNNNKCEWAMCRFRHVCANCEKPNHIDSQCPEPPRKRAGFFRPYQQ